MIAPSRKEALPSGERLPSIKETTQTRLDMLQDELKKTKDGEQKLRIRHEILSIKREFNRTRQYTEISGNKIAEGKTSLDTISASDLMKLDKEASKEKRGEFLAKSFLYKRTTDNEGNISEEAYDGKNLKEGDIIIVDFGKNKQANNRIGLGHMLGANIEYVKVNGKIGMRTIINNRVGYYVDNNPRGYIPVFTGDEVTIPTKQEIDTFNEATKDRGLVKNTSQEDSDKANDIYISKLESSSLESIEINTNIQESYDFWKSKGFTHEQACGIIANEYRESNANPRATGDNGKAKGIFQWHPDRRDAILRGTGINIETATHQQQLEAAYWEFTQGAENKIFAPIKNAKTAQEVAIIFSEGYERPANREFENNTRGQMAEAFAMLLDTEGRSTNLGDHVVARGPTNTGANSCGAAVRTLLKSYGITGLPETGANGKNWESILNERGEQFIKIKIGHPDQAYPGAILVYDGSGTDGSSMNKAFGHVEIKGSDGKYYSYYEGSRAGGSAATNEKDPTKYSEITGFTGYAYYPKQKHS